MEDNTFTFGVYLSCSKIIWGIYVPQTQTLCQLTLPLMWKVTLSLNWTLRISRYFQCCIWSPCRILTKHQIFLSFSTSTGRNLCRFTNKSLRPIFEVFILGSYNSSFGRRNNFCRPRLKHLDHWPKVPQKHKADQDSCVFTCTFSVECILQAQTDTSLGGFMWNSVRDSLRTSVTDSLLAKCRIYQLFLFGVSIFKTSGI
jgi:hypothetical protein